METNMEALVRLITDKVLANLENESAKKLTEHVQSESVPQPKILAIFTGGTIGLVEGMAAVRELMALPAEVQVVLSAAAEEVIGIKRIKDSLGEQCSLFTSKDPYPGKILKAADLVIVPVMTQNTVAKLAMTIADSLPSTLLMQALMMGKKVIAARNAADPQDSWRAKAGMAQAPQAVLHLLQHNLQKVESFGVKLVDVHNLVQETSLQWQPAVSQAAAPPALMVKPIVQHVQPQVVKQESKPQVGRTFITAEMIKAVALAGKHTYQVGTGAILTPLAKDIATEYGVEILEV